MNHQSLVGDAVTELIARAQHEIDTGRLPACQLALARDGEVVADRTLGAAQPDARFTVFSVTKAYIAAAAWLLIGDGLLTADTCVVDLVPEFATNGKETVTVEHLLTHTAGFPRAPMRPEDGASSLGRVARFATWRLDWPPGSQLEYHATSAHWVVAELIERVSGLDYRAFMAERIAGPLGLRRLQLGVPVGAGDDVVDLVMMADTDGDLGIAEAKPDMLLRYNEPEVRAVGVPGAGAVSTAADIALFYQALLHNPGGLWDPAVLADGTGNVRTKYVDPLRGVAAYRTLGLSVAGDDGNGLLRDFGKATSPRAFGASGLGGQIAWADPETGLSFCWLTNGLTPDIVTTFRRSAGLSTRAANCVVREADA
ncbi:MAG: serine hydrolase domain-containing protein [Actinomycetes bacterium]